MSTHYRLDLYNRQGVRFAQLGWRGADMNGRGAGFRALSYTRRVNSAGTLAFTLTGKHELLPEIEAGQVVEVWRKSTGGNWTRDFTGVVNLIDYVYGDQPEAAIHCDGILSLLGWRTIEWLPDTDGRSRFLNTPAETILKSLARYNITSFATTANGRQRSGVNWPANWMSISADQGRGTRLDWFCAYDNLLLSMQELASIGGGGFDLERAGATSLVLHWHAGQRGEDRTASQVFSITNGNMTDVSYSIDHRNAATVALVGGAGVGPAREMVIVSGPDYGPNNDIELFVDARDIATGNTSALTARGQAELDRRRPKETFKYSVLETEYSRYGVHYNLGDLVTAVNPITRASYTQKVTQVSVVFDENGEAIAPVMETV